MSDLERWWPWVYGVARRVARKHRRWTIGELASWGFDGLRSGLRCYREQEGWPLKRYLGYRVSGAMADGMRQTRWQLLPESECRVESVAVPDRDDLHFLELVQFAQPRYRELLILYYRDGWTLKMLAKERNLSEARVCQLLQEARAEIKEKVVLGDSRGE